MGEVLHYGWIFWNLLILSERSTGREDREKGERSGTKRRRYLGYML